MEILVYNMCGTVASKKFYSWHNDFAVAACTKFGSDVILYNIVLLKLISHRIRNTMENCSLNSLRLNVSYI